MRKVLPISMIISVAVLGCTMNHTPGNGQPVTATPSMGTATTPGTSYGNTPMSSSYAEPQTNNLSRADQAAAILRGHQAYQPRFLGYLSPDPRSQQPAQQYVTGQVVPPALAANPQLTVNSSISSQAYPVITGSDADLIAIDNFAGVFPGGTTTTPGTTAPATVGGTTTPATSVGALTPTAVSGMAPSPIASANIPGQTGMASASSAAPSTTAAARLGGARIVIPSTGSATTAPISVSASPSGQLMISNAHH
jgi:hypothetical protein